jgi:hypothetical protein
MGSFSILRISSQAHSAQISYLPYTRHYNANQRNFIFLTPDFHLSLIIHLVDAAQLL